jgi:hypothetical protein
VLEIYYDVALFSLTLHDFGAPGPYIMAQHSALVPGIRLLTGHRLRLLTRSTIATGMQKLPIMLHVWAAHMHGTSLLLLFCQLNNCRRSASHAVYKNRWNVALVLDCMQKTLSVVSSELGLPRTACGLGKDGYPGPGILAREAQVVIGLRPHPNN